MWGVQAQLNVGGYSTWKEGTADDLDTADEPGEKESRMG